VNVLVILASSSGAFHIGLAYLAGALKTAGHNAGYLPVTEVDVGKLRAALDHWRPQLVLLSFTTDTRALCRDLARVVKQLTSNQTPVPIFAGGVHATFCPEDTLAIDELSGLCRGEGEQAVVHLANRLAAGQVPTGIPNLWVRHRGAVDRNELAPLVEDLDALAPPDYGIFKAHQSLRVLPIILTRGCSLGCTYCCNHAYRELYRGKGKFLRHHSVSYSIELIGRLLREFPEAHAVEFYDDTFILNRRWLTEFLAEYSRLRVPFVCNGRFDLLDRELVELLAQGGCVRLNAAVEAGSETIRREVLGRDMSDSVIRDGARLVREAGIHLYTHNMVGIPFETEDDIIETAALNRAIYTDSVQVSVFNPYPGTRLRKQCEDRGWIDKHISVTSFRDQTVLRTPHIAPARVNYLFLTFKALVFDEGLTRRAIQLLAWVMHLHRNYLYRRLRRNRLFAPVLRFMFARERTPRE
jgi:radical SAM superfamily enzyme YgiQ (UPF0313 family)